MTIQPLWLLGFPAPVLEFFIGGVLLFLLGSITLGRNIEDVDGVESTTLSQRREERDRSVKSVEQ